MHLQNFFWKTLLRKTLKKKIVENLQKNDITTLDRKHDPQKSSKNISRESMNLCSWTFEQD